MLSRSQLFDMDSSPDTDRGIDGIFDVYWEGESNSPIHSQLIPGLYGIVASNENPA